MMVEIEAILFDVGGTLRNTTRKTREEKISLVCQLMKLIGAEGDPLAFSRRLARRYAAYRTWAQETLVELSEADLWAKWILPEFPAEIVRPNAVQLNQLYRDSTGTRKVDPMTRDVVVELFRRGYRLGIVSNTTSSMEVPALLKELGISGCFETVILSTVVGKRKPDPGILLDAAARMGVKPECCTYIGDRPERDVAASCGAGFARTVLIRGRKSSASSIHPLEFAPDHVIDHLDELLAIFPVRKDSRGGRSHRSAVYDVAFSTMWMRKNLPSLNDFFLAAQRFGFAKVELNHQMNSAILQEANLDRVKISSIHEPCPADISMDQLKQRDWLISALDEEKRLPGVEAVKHSIDLASQVGAAYIVVHAGSINSSQNLERKLRSLYENGQAGSAEFQALVEEMRTERLALAGEHFSAVQRSIQELIDYAAPKGIRLGIENRYHFLEFPSPDELEILLQLGGADQIGFVFDAGHSYTLDRLSFYPQMEWLEQFSQRMIGMHLHDVVGLIDHHAPGTGEIDFDRIAPYLPDAANRTFELQVFNSAEKVKASLEYLAAHRCIQKIS